MDTEYVGIDFHRRRSVIVRLNGQGERLSVVRIANEPAGLAVAAAGPCPQVVIEATYGWYWAVDLLQSMGARVHLANPKVLDWGERRVKNDVIASVRRSVLVRWCGVDIRRLLATATEGWRLVASRDVGSDREQGQARKPLSPTERPRHDSNMRHTVPETDALSPELRGRDVWEDSHQPS